MQKITIIAAMCSMLAGLIIIVPGVMLAEFLESVEKNEVNAIKEVLSRLILETIYLKNGYFGTVGNAISGLYDASDLVTEEEFVTFATIMLQNSPSIENILVFDSAIIHSYPMQEFTSLEPRLLQATMTHEDTRYLVLINRADSKVSTAIFINPENLVPLAALLQPPFKAVLYVDEERIFGVEGTRSGGTLPRAVLSSDEVNKAIKINGSLGGGGVQSEINLAYLVYQSNFEAPYEWLYWVIVLGGFVLGCIVASLIFLEIKTRSKLVVQNKNLKTNSEMLKKIESLLLESEERYRNLFELSPNPVCTLDMDGKVASTNSRVADVFGYEKTDVLGRHFTDFVSESDASLSVDLFKKVLSTGHIQDVNITCKKKGGTLFGVNISANTFINKDAKVIGVIVVITPLK